MRTKWARAAPGNTKSLTALRARGASTKQRGQECVRAALRTLRLFQDLLPLRASAMLATGRQTRVTTGVAPVKLERLRTVRETCRGRMEHLLATAVLSKTAVANVRRTGLQSLWPQWQESSASACVASGGVLAKCVLLASTRVISAWESVSVARLEVRQWTWAHQPSLTVLLL